MWVHGLRRSNSLLKGAPLRDSYLPRVITSVVWFPPGAVESLVDPLSAVPRGRIAGTLRIARYVVPGKYGDNWPFLFVTFVIS